MRHMGCHFLVVYLLFDAVLSRYTEVLVLFVCLPYFTYKG